MQRVERGFRRQGKIAVLGIRETGIGIQGCEIVPSILSPLVERLGDWLFRIEIVLAQEKGIRRGIRACDIEKEVALGKELVFAIDLFVGVGGMEEWLSIHQKDVQEKIDVMRVANSEKREAERLVRPARKGEPGFSREGANVIAEDVFASEMLMEKFLAATQADIALDYDSGRAFVRIDSPSAVVPAGNIGDVIGVHVRTRLNPQQVNSTHIAENAFAEVFDAIPADSVFACDLIGISPIPTNGDSGIVEIADLIVFDEIAEGMAQKNAGGGMPEKTAIGNGVSDDGYARSPGSGIRLG